MYFQAIIFASALSAFTPPDNPLHMEAAVPPTAMEIEDYRLTRKPWWLRACTKNWQWVTIDPNIYHPPHLVPASYPAIIEHEKTHIAQQRRAGKYRWLIKYIASKKFRLNQELEPIVIELSNLPLEARLPMATKYANNLAGPPYSRAAKSAEVALEAIRAKAEEMGVELTPAAAEAAGL